MDISGGFSIYSQDLAHFFWCFGIAGTLVSLFQLVIVSLVVTDKAKK